jgi:hypothetical protein
MPFPENRPQHTTGADGDNGRTLADEWRHQPKETTGETQEAIIEGGTSMETNDACMTLDAVTATCIWEYKWIVAGTGKTWLRYFWREYLRIYRIVIRFFGQSSQGIWHRYLAQASWVRLDTFFSFALASVVLANSVKPKQHFPAIASFDHGNNCFYTES